MKIIESILKLNECFVTGKKIPIKGIMLHSVGVSQPSAQTFVRSWNTAKPGGRSVCVHAFLEQNGDVYQTLPWDYRAWHCGSGPKGSANDTHIGVEMTEPSTIQYNPNGSWVDKDPAKTKSFILGTYNTAVELFAKLCKDFKLDPLKDGVIISHT
ncbi:MAG: peptidoglycan recognition protein family protein, partial [Clostridiales bacterium]|nr:peptidoglycan recognition protein family protein [Clostridiales bacterium]